MPHTADTHDVLNARSFAKLAHGAYLINVARGSLAASPASNLGMSSTPRAIFGVAVDQKRY
ncbi:hypothetical protein BN2475_280024 [Paraburkholderia ribeironis]|uniref:D-isomer specific 2-hydroxyacid dehydrogenase NAD-binding domain-containing protein n=1 Tax=Paraburkholderia ribeironis TaxID=1247936 RepID=A0A1N7S1B0_9BURK|nr:hypothetical protein BN2475_280024 [Paraburkholderia ribeironis]